MNMPPDPSSPYVWFFNRPSATATAQAVTLPATDDTLDRLTNSFDRLGVQWTRTTASGLRTTLQSVIEAPAVGAPLPFDGLALPKELVDTDPSPAALEAAGTGITAVRMAIAATGTIVIESTTGPTEAASLFPRLHIAVLRRADVVPSIKAAFAHLGPALRNEHVTAVLATGPSATADMGALVRGAHGPAQVHVLIVDPEKVHDP